MEAFPKGEKKIYPPIESPRISYSTRQFKRLAKEVVEAGESYDLILSDDASARLVSLFMKKVLDSFLPEGSSKTIDTRFVTPHRGVSETTMNAIGEMLKKLSPKRTLVVTEFVSRGQSIRALAEALAKQNLNFDIAVLHSARTKEEIEQMFLSYPDAQLFLGEDRSDTPHLNGYYGGAGVQGGNLNSHIPEKFKYPEEKYKENLNQAREDISNLAQETIDELKGN
jgi:hypothetical protein